MKKWDVRVSVCSDIEPHAPDFGFCVYDDDLPLFLKRNPGLKFLFDQAAKAK